MKKLEEMSHDEIKALKEKIQFEVLSALNNIERKYQKEYDLGRVLIAVESSVVCYETEQGELLTQDLRLNIDVNFSNE